MRVWIRGIHATVLTHLFHKADHAMVQTFSPIRARFEIEFAVEESDIGIETPDDRQGVGIRGDPTAVHPAFV